MTPFVDALKNARAYAKKATNPLLDDDPDDIAEVWNGLRDLWDIQTGGELTARQLDLVADEILDIWRMDRDHNHIAPRRASLCRSRRLGVA